MKYTHSDSQQLLVPCKLTLAAVLRVLRVFVESFVDLILFAQYFMNVFSKFADEKHLLMKNCNDISYQQHMYNLKLVPVVETCAT